MQNPKQGLPSKVLITAILALGIVFFSKFMPSSKDSALRPELLVEVDTHDSSASSMGNQDPSSSSSHTNNLKPASNEAEIQKCFSDYKSSDSLGRLRHKLLHSFKLPEANVDYEEYHLIGQHNENYRIHYDTNAPFKEVVRVYKIGADNLPDVISSFSNAKSSRFDEQLDGALQLGTLQKKVLKMKSQVSLSLLLEYDEEAGSTTSLHFVNRTNELLCNVNGCTCKQF